MKPRRSRSGVQKKIVSIVREKREAVGMSQQVLAEKAGVTQPYISYVERTGKLNIEKAPQIAAALGCDWRDLYIDAD